MPVPCMWFLDSKELELELDASNVILSTIAEDIADYIIPLHTDTLHRSRDNLNKILLECSHK